MNKNRNLILLLGICLFSLTGCMGAADDYEFESHYGDSYSYAPSKSDGYYGDGYIRVPDSFNKNVGNITAGQLTGKALFDNLDYNYEFFCNLVAKNEKKGEFFDYQTKFNLDYKRIKVTVKNAPYAQVSLWNADNVDLWDSVADINGETYLFSNNDANKIAVTVGDETKTYDVTDNLIIEDFTGGTAHEKIQLLLTLDTTGSMGDELDYLKAELVDVISKVKEDTNSDVEVGIIAYRDKNEAYLTKKMDFTSNIDSALNYLTGLDARNGGDFEEAVQEAFNDATEFSWDENATKILIHVADAPSHDEDVKSWFNSVKCLNGLGVRILTVASSGIDKKTEYFFRMQSLQTNGCYAFLTDDSNIGNGHLEATNNDEMITEYLNKLLIRVINGFHTGIMEDPVPYYNGYTEILEYNEHIELTKVTQSIFATYYVEQFGKDAVNPKVKIEYYFPLRNGPYPVYIKDNFTEVHAIETRIKISDFEFVYPTDYREIMIFVVDSFYTLDYAFEYRYITYEQLKSIYEQTYMFQAK